MLEEEYIYIPVDQSEEVVAVPLSDLPDDPEEIVDVLKAEVVPFSLWVDFARAYLAQDKLPQYQKLLSFGTLKDVEDFYREKGKFESIQLLCELAATHVDAARAESSRSSKTERLAQAATLLTRARQLDYQEQLPSIGLGELALARVSMPWHCSSIHQRFSEGAPELPVRNHQHCCKVACLLRMISRVQRGSSNRRPSTAVMARRMLRAS